ncbi:hypothetical protein QTJ16_006036 [Diplocarpon rosae]|uniref:Non-structural maintenance of chromosomes element 4 n=1 Tax=Diplocarpon rosae TaxID=946125 RepID=A0AAD9WC36_9HELO|nr:hypothetical protein QTJ16_006036 [Diplocarpon rosae]PBP23497.1 nuclear protein Qri2/Nse4 [Diplocarpon rosae]
MAPAAGKTSESPAPSHDDLYESSLPPRRSRISDNETGSHSPMTSISSDKENRTRPALDKGKGRAPMGFGLPSSAASPRDYNKRKRGSTDEPFSNQNNSRRRTAGLEDPGTRNSRKRTVDVEEEDEEGEEVTEARSNRRRQSVEIEDGASEDSFKYDPDQPINVRRRIRKGLRDLDRTLQNNRAEYLLPNSTGLRDTLIAANTLSKKVKQTSDATIDAKLLATAADYSYRKTVALITGDTSQGIDIDEFLIKIRQFMRRGDDAEAAPSSTQRARRDDGEDDGEALNWAYLGRNACIMHNLRPSVPGFLLGPLSVEKRTKRNIVRKATLKHTQIQATRPEVLQAGDVKKDKNNNLSDLCKSIKEELTQRCAKNQGAVESLANDSMSEAEVRELMDRFDIAEDGGLAYFKFVINPWSFGQTVENIFYVSFLIRDGAAGISTDDRGLPYLNICSDEEREIAVKGDQPKHQAVISIDMNKWESLIEAFDIKEPMIRHREEEEYGNVGAKGWYA